MNNKIILDLDGVITDIDSLIDETLESYGVSEDYSSWLTTDTKHPEALKLFSNPVFWKNLKPFEDAWYQVNYWFGRGFDVHILTARRSEASVNATAAWLDDWKINTMTPQFSALNEKYKIAKEINPVYMVEDNPSEVKILLEHGVNCFLRKAWYNKSYWEELPTIDSLYDIDL